MRYNYTQFESGKPIPIMTPKYLAGVFTVAGAIWLLPLSVSAQQHTLKSAAQKALAGNPEVLQKWHSYEATAQEREAAWGGYLPRVDLAAGIGREQRDDPLLKRDYSRRSASLTLTQMLYDGFATREEVRRLDHAQQSKLFELFDASEAVALETARAYLDVLRYRKLVELAEENYVRHRAVFEQIQQKAKAGVARRVDLEQASGRLALAESNLLTETSNLHDVSARYQRLVGEAPPAAMAEPAGLDKGLPANGGEALKLAQSNHPAVQAAIENLRASEAAVGTRRAAYQPRVDFKLRNERGTDLNGYTGSTDNRTAEVVLTWNLFNGFSDRARSRQAAEQRNVAGDLRDKACRDVRQTTAIAFNDTRKLTEQLGYLDQHQLATEKARDAYRKQFDIGQRTLLDLLDTENELFQAKRAYRNAEYDLMIAQARTQAGVGRLLGTLDLSRLADRNLPDGAGWEMGADAPEQCPPEAPVLYVANKAALDARAAELLRESAPVPAPQVAPVAEAGLRAAVAAWAAAWSARDVAAHLGYYAESFQPADGISREAWAAKRRRTIDAAAEIRLAIDDLKIATGEGGLMTTTFRQAYQSPSYQDVVTKTLYWQSQQGQWRIVREVITP